MVEGTTQRVDRLSRLRRRHYDCYFDLARIAEETQDRASLDVLDAELPNLRNALEWGIAVRHPTVVAFAASLAWYWQSSRRFGEGRDLLAQALLQADVPPIDRIAALRGAALLAWEQGDVEGARDGYDAARKLAASEGNLALQGRAAADLGYALYRLGLMGPAGEVFAEAVALGDYLDMRDRTAAMRGLAWTSSGGGEFELGIRLHRDARILLEKSDHPDLAVHCAAEANFLVFAGADEEAFALGDQVLKLARAAGNATNLLIALESRASAARSVGEEEIRRSVLEEGVQVAREAHSSREAFFQLELAGDAVAAGDLSAAHGALARALQVLDELEALSLKDQGVDARLQILQARLGEDEGDLKVAEECYRKAVASKGASRAKGEGLVELARMLAEHGDTAGARLAQNEAVAASSDPFTAIERRSDLAVFEDDLDEALRLRSEAVELARKPKVRVEARRRRAEVLAEMGQPAQARVDLDDAVGSQPERSDPVVRARLRVDRARLRITAGDSAGSRADLGEAQRLARVAWAADQLHLAATLARLALLEGRRDRSVQLWRAVADYRAANRRVTPRLSQRFEEPLRGLDLGDASRTLDSRAALDALGSVVSQEFEDLGI